MTREAVNEGLERMDLMPAADLSKADWHALTVTDNGSLCNDKGELDLRGWRLVCRRQLCVYVLSVVADAQALAHASEPSDVDMLSAASWLPALKLLLLSESHKHEPARGPGMLKE